jgi:hypothetical protein
MHPVARELPDRPTDRFRPDRRRDRRPGPRLGYRHSPSCPARRLSDRSRRPVRCCPNSRRARIPAPSLVHYASVRSPRRLPSAHDVSASRCHPWLQLGPRASRKHRANAKWLAGRRISWAPWSQSPVGRRGTSRSLQILAGKNLRRSCSSMGRAPCLDGRLYGAGEKVLLCQQPCACNQSQRQRQWHVPKGRCSHDPQRPHARGVRPAAGARSCTCSVRAACRSACTPCRAAAIPRVPPRRLGTS